MMNLRKCRVCSEQITRNSGLCENCLQAKLVIQRASATFMSLYGLPSATGVCVDCNTRSATHRDHRRYSLPLNVENVCGPCNIKRGQALDLDDLIRIHRGLQIEQTEPVDRDRPFQPLDLNQQVDQHEQGLIEDALKLSKGNITKAADSLGITFRSLRHRLAKLGMSV